MDETPDFLSEEGPAPAPEQPVEGNQPRDEQGRFAQTAVPVTAQPEPQPAEPPAQPPAQPQEPQQSHSVPLPTFLELRDRLTAAETQLKQFSQPRQQEAPPPEPEMPVLYEDATPAEIAAYVEAQREFTAMQAAQSVRSQATYFSRALAEVRHGADVVREAHEWAVRKADEDPLFNEKAKRHPDPYELAVTEFRRDRAVSQIGDGDMDEFIRWKASRNQQPQAGQPAAPQKPVAPGPSLAGAPSAGVSSAPQVLDGDATYQRMFGQ